jgi:hypothetical protein
MAAKSTSAAQNQCAPAIICLVVGVVIFILFMSNDIIPASDPEFFVFFIVAFALIISCAIGSSTQAAKRRQALTAQGTYTTQPQPQPAPAYQPQVQFQPQPQYNPQPQLQSQPHVIEREKVIIKEIVKIKCQYCGALVESTQSFCHNCGANM